MGSEPAHLDNWMMAQGDLDKSSPGRMVQYMFGFHPRRFDTREGEI